MNIGGTIIYQIGYPCDDPVEEDMTLMPVRIDEDTLEAELNDLLFAISDKHEGKFVKKKDVAVFDVLFKKILEKLRKYHDSNPREIGEAAGERLIKRLKEVGTNDNMFPEYEIKMVRDTVTDVWE